MIDLGLDMRQVAKIRCLRFWLDGVRREKCVSLELDKTDDAKGPYMGQTICHGEIRKSNGGKQVCAFVNPVSI